MAELTFPHYLFRNGRATATIWILAVITGLLAAILPVEWIMVALAGATVLTLTAVQPLLVLAIALVAAPFGALESVILGGLSIDSGQILLGVALAGWIGRGLVQRQLKVPRSSLLPPLLIFVFLACVSLLNAPDLILGLKEVLKWVEIILIMMMVTDLAQDWHGKDGIWAIAFMLLMSGLVQATVGIWQFGLRGDGPEHFLVLERYYRAYGTFEQPNPYGGFMNLNALLALGILMALFSDWLLGMMGRRPAGADSLRSGWGMLLFFSAIGVAAFASILGLIFSWSRGAWMGFLAGLASMVVLWPRRTRYGLASLGVAGLLGLAMWQVGLVPTTVESRISSFTSDLTLGDVRGVDINDANYAVLERVAHWQAALDMARDHLWLGVGFGNYGAAYPNYALLNWPDALGHAHNYYLNLFAELGLLGLIAYLIAWMTIFWQTYRVLRRERTAVRGIALGLMGIWVALSVHHLVDKLYVNNIYIHLGVLLGLLQLADLHAASGEQVGEIEAGR